jgi:hypothetical protein
MEKLIHIGLVKGISGKYCLTSFDKVVFSIEMKIVEAAIKYNWSLKSIDSIVMTSAEEKELALGLKDNILVAKRILITL